MDEYSNLKIATLFHEIGKFYQRADNLGKSNHAYDSKYEKLDANDYGYLDYCKWSADFVKDYFSDTVENLVLYHHTPDKSQNPELCRIIQNACRHSSTGSDNADKIVPLTSVFSKISLDDDKKEEYYVPLVELDFKKPLHPQNKEAVAEWNLVQKYKDLWNNFVNEFEKSKNKNVETMLAILKKYTSTMPVAFDDSQNDITLYDHLKTTLALSNCLYLFSKENTGHGEVYKVIMGDMSGIQNFIYKVQSPEDAQSGMSKRLRGRSLYLTLLCEAIASRIITDLNLDSSNILFCGGGRFTIIAPNTSKTDEIIDKINYEINKMFIDKFNAELFLNIVSTPVSGDNLSAFDKIQSHLTKLLNDNKKHKFQNLLDELFTVESQISYNLCPVCGNPSDAEFCKDCSEHEKLGQAVANAKYLIKYTSSQKISNSLYYDSLNVGYLFKNDKTEVEEFINQNQDVDFVVYKLNDTDFLEFDISSDNIVFDFKVIGNSIPNIDATPLYFNHLAEISKGANKLGVLKMDVDNLGLIFSKGFTHLGDGATSISRISSLSFYLDLFFSGRINQIVEKFAFTNELSENVKSTVNTIDFLTKSGEVYKSKTIYKALERLPKGVGTSTIHINYSCGDDLLVVGPYDDIIGFADEFQRRFKKWTANNDSINISAGISIVSPKFPIGKAAIMADEELEKSKDCGRNKITVFGETLRWKSNGLEKGFDELFDFAHKLEDLNESGELSRGFTYSLLKIWNNNFVSNKTISNEREWMLDVRKRLQVKSYIPIFKYKLRLIDNNKIMEDIDKNGIKFMPWIKTPVSWVSLRLR